MSLPTHIPAVVLWLGPTGLTVVRALGRAGIQVHAAHDNADDPSAGTRFADVRILPRIEDDERPWLDYLLEMARTLAPHRPALFVSSDMHWLLVARNRLLLEPLFRFPFSTSPDVLDWPTKSFQYKIAAHAGVPFPRTSTPQTMGLVRQLAAEIQFPVLVKPTHAHLWRQVYSEKLAFITSAPQLIDRCQKAFTRNLSFVVQEYIPAADNEVFSLMSCADSSSQILTSCVARKIRQFHPRFGCSSFTTTAHQPVVAEQARRLIQAIGYHGISSIEFKRDPRDGVFKLMEMNLRPPSLMAAVVDSGFNLPLVCYHDLCGHTLELPAKTRVGRSVGILAKDFHAFRFNQRMGTISWFAWLKSWFFARDLYFAWDDLRPFRGYVHTLLDHYRKGVYRDCSWMPTQESWSLGLYSGPTAPTQAAPEIKSAIPQSQKSNSLPAAPSLAR